VLPPPASKERSSGFFFCGKDRSSLHYGSSSGSGSVLMGSGTISSRPPEPQHLANSRTTCPVCHTQLKLLQIKLREVFECPSCKERLSLSDGYQNVMRFAAAFAFCSLVLLTLILLTDWIPGNLGAWLTYPVSYGFATSCKFLYRRAFTRLFPPRLQRGTPHFITLNLAARPRTKAAEGEDNETNE
jgi:uncharacterized protein YbaR (Trm112 family)